MSSDLARAIARAWLDVHKPDATEAEIVSLAALFHYATLGALDAGTKRAEDRVRRLWASLDGWCPCRDSDGLERVLRAIQGTP